MPYPGKRPPGPLHFHSEIPNRVAVITEEVDIVVFDLPPDTPELDHYAQGSLREFWILG